MPVAMARSRLRRDTGSVRTSDKGNLLLERERASPTRAHRSAHPAWELFEARARYARGGGARGDAIRTTVADAIETVGATSRSRGHGAVVATPAGGTRKCRTWRRCWHTAQSDPSWAGSRRVVALRGGGVSSKPAAQMAMG